MNDRPFFRRTNFWLQALLWVAALMMPLMFMAPDETITLSGYLRRLVMPVSLVALFYANYLWLAPKYLQQEGKATRLVAINLVMVVALTLGLSEWMEYDRKQHHKEHSETHRHHHNKEASLHMFYIGMVRDFYYLCAVTILGCTVVMSRQWMTAENKRKEAEVARREAELTILRNQTNPHFLLNTLNNIYALTAFNPPQAQEAIMELSKILRYVLYENQKPYVSLANEVEAIGNYVKLMKLRLTADVEVNTNIHLPSPCTIQIAPMIIITLVENAFKHGVSPTLPSHIDITIAADQDKIECLVENSYHPKSEKDHSGHGIGLVQVGKRLELSYPGKYTWEKGPNKDHTLYTSKIIIYDTQLHHH